MDGQRHGIRMKLFCGALLGNPFAIIVFIVVFLIMIPFDIIGIIWNSVVQRSRRNKYRKEIIKQYRAGFRPCDLGNS